VLHLIYTVLDHQPACLPAQRRANMFILTPCLFNTDAHTTQAVALDGARGCLIDVVSVLRALKPTNSFLLPFSFFSLHRTSLPSSHLPPSPRPMTQPAALGSSIYLPNTYRPDTICRVDSCDTVATHRVDIRTVPTLCSNGPPWLRTTPHTTPCPVSFDGLLAYHLRMAPESLLLWTV